MPDLAILRLLSSVEEVSFTRSIAIDPPLRRAIAVAVLGNPYAGRYVDDLTPLGVLGESLAYTLGQRAMELLGGADNVATYGKAALIGLQGELEHGAAVLHPRMGAALRKLIGNATTMIPSVTKTGPAGAMLDIPLHHVRDQWSFDHFDTASITVADAPAPDELMIAIAMSNRGRPLARTIKHEV